MSDEELNLDIFLDFNKKYQFIIILSNMTNKKNIL